jgi:hypothetical protein
MEDIVLPLCAHQDETYVEVCDKLAELAEQMELTTHVADIERC